ncbi:MAG: isochorismatase family protein [Planctomycetes bacterium]|nr:isochorismatase family protein [Planctomycetota bacterium]
MRKGILVDIDTQIDFMKRNGALYVPEAEDIIPRVDDMMEYAAGFGIRILSTMDTHTKDDPEFAEFSPHCVKGTPGWQKLPITLHDDRVVLPLNWKPPLPDDILERQQIIVEKSTYDPFSSPAFEAVIQLLKSPKCMVFGVATDYCVRAACLGLLERRCKVNLIINSTKPVLERTGRDTIEELKNMGVEFITSAEVMRVAV